MASLEAGRRLADRYVLKERLGDGGHAEVWAALDEPTGRLVALKFLHLRSCSVEDALPVLQHEARMAQRLEHPGVLRVEDPQRDGDYVFLPIEYAPGGGASRLRGASWQRVVPVVLQVARVLEHAHARGVVHRDIKPGNVLFADDGTVRLADFGTSARTGSAEAPATGSPFAASPQQLRGDAATPADDVYGLGALTYELLTRYPPFYPDFDAARMQQQEPAPPVPVHPTPQALLELVQAMLARDAAARPSLAAVISELERCIALPAEEGSVVIEAPQASVASPRQSARRRIAPWWWLGAAAAAGAAALLMLPEPASKTTLPALASTAPEVTRVADALVVEPAPASQVDNGGVVAQPAALPAGAASAQETVVGTLADELRAGQQALTQLKPAAARAAFQRALLQQADDAEAKAGLAAAARLEDLVAALAEGTRAEAGGDLAGARERYRLLLANQPDFAPARTALTRVESRLAGRQFEEHLAVAADALQRGRIADAQAAYASAAAISPRDARVLDGQQRIAEIQRNRQNMEDLETGAALEGAERWDEALAHYRGVLERDANLRFAQDGLGRSERRAALDRELADYMARPERLTAPAVRQSAQRALARGEATAANAPRLASQLSWLRQALGAASEPVRVELISDNSTQVSVMRVGELGVFQVRHLTLPPGQYTVIGRREGFRDVRLVLNLAPGQPDTALAVQCTERI